ncbi:MAG: M48 family metalloprotease [Candidatus Limnocylindrales bacterium]
MNRRLAGVLVALAVLAVATAATCAAALSAWPGDPLRVPEFIGGVVLVWWIALAVRIVVRGARLGRLLGQHASPTEMAGITVQILPGGGRQAFVLGWLRPRIYVGHGLLSHLEDDEVLAVLRHEEHHRRTRAPLRAAALEAWSDLLRPLGPAHRAVANRLVDLEIEADRAALHAGSSPSALARALLEADRLGSAGTSFASAADRRVLWLTGGKHDARDGLRATLPYEWLPIVAFGLFIVACHVGVGPLR